MRLLRPAYAAARGSLAALALSTAACTPPDGEPESRAAPPEAAAAAAALPRPDGTQTAAADAPPPLGPAPEDVPTVYMSLEAETGRPVSIVFAIDAGGAPGPADDSAVRLTPEGGRCNPQELSGYGFEGEDARPAFGPAQAAGGVDPRRLPEFMAVAVSRRMIERGLAGSPEETQPQNVCTRKLWERLVTGQTQTAAAPAGQ